MWRYFDPTDYAEAVLRDAPLDAGEITIESIDHVPHLRRLRHLQNARLDLRPADRVNDLTFLCEAPPVITYLWLQAEGPLDLTPLANCPALEALYAISPGGSTGVEALAELTGLRSLSLSPPDNGRDLSFLADCPALRTVILNHCTELTDLSTLVSASALQRIYLWSATSLCDLQALADLADLRWLSIDHAPLSGGLDTVASVLDRLSYLGVWSVPTVTCLDALAETALVSFNLVSCPVTDLDPVGALRSLNEVGLGHLTTVNLAPLATLPHLQNLHLWAIEEPVDLSPLALTHHRLRVRLSNTDIMGDPGPLATIRKN
jgi:hypothetical protein